MTPSSLLSKIYVLALLPLLLWGCGNQDDLQDNTAQASPASATIRQISVEKARAIMAKDSAALVIDVRTPPEFSGPLGHVPGAQLKPLQNIADWSGELEQYKERDIILICRSGNRSNKAAQYLQEKGFTNLINVQGGMRKWNEVGYPVKKQ